MWHQCSLVESLCGGGNIEWRAMVETAKVIHEGRGDFDDACEEELGN